MTAASMVTSETLAAVTTAVSGSPLLSQARWILDPGLPRSTGFAPTWSPAFGAHAGRVHARARPVQPARQTKPVQHLQVELLEHPRLGPLVQPAPCRRRRATAKFLGWQEPPRGRGAGHVDDRGETVAIGTVRRRLPYQGRGAAGRTGATICHSSSGTRSSARVVMTRNYDRAAAKERNAVLDAADRPRGFAELPEAPSDPDQQVLDRGHGLAGGGGREGGGDGQLVV
jgi:hypothetical protein